METERDAERRTKHIEAPEDAQIAALCESIGYGAVMDSVARLWRKRYGGSAFWCGPCVDSIRRRIGLRPIGPTEAMLRVPRG